MKKKRTRKESLTKTYFPHKPPDALTMFHTRAEQSLEQQSRANLPLVNQHNWPLLNEQQPLTVLIGLYKTGITCPASLRKKNVDWCHLRSKGWWLAGSYEWRTLIGLSEGNEGRWLADCKEWRAMTGRSQELNDLVHKFQNNIQSVVPLNLNDKLLTNNFLFYIISCISDTYFETYKWATSEENGSWYSWRHHLHLANHRQALSRKLLHQLWNSNYLLK